MKPKMSEILIGITYRKAFRILDDVGSIFDELLYGKDSFTPEYFPQIEYNGFQKVLKNNDTGNYLSMSADGVVYNHHVEDKENDAITAMVERVNKIIVPRILEQYRLAISRIGIVFSFEVDKESIDRFKSKYFKDGVDVRAFRFSISDGTISAAMEKNTKDYTNMIFTISQEEDHFKVAFDYQQYFIPNKASWDDCRPSNFFANAQKALKEKLLDELESKAS
ncbi:MAG: hypothetical protein IKR85_02480 [Clostridia bacterium]|nr:hypothetical protein [Clostridia bacterium]